MLQKARANPRISLKADWEGECLRRLTGIALETEPATHATKSVLFDLKEKIQELSIKAKRGLIIAPIGFFLNKCPDCGRKIDKVVLRDGGYPDYGSKYKYYSCSCGYEFGKVVF